MNAIIPIILAGGSGKRLWPISRPELPKQFAPIFGKSNPTLFQNTLLRLQELLAKPPIIICNQNHAALVQKQLQEVEIKNAKVILEPLAKNTAPAIAIAAFLTLQEQKNPTLLVLPSDHVIDDTASFITAVALADKLANRGDLVCFGIKPTSAETEYGYLQAGEKLSFANSYKIARFVEKPNAILARRYLKAGNYYWNSGMFVFQAESFLQELQAFAPDIFAVSKQIVTKLRSTSNLFKIPKAQFAKCRSDSIDYAVMEHTQKGALVELDAGWNDIGSLPVLWQYLPKDQKGNVIFGDIYFNNDDNLYIHALTHKVVAKEVKNCIIVEMENDVLVVSMQGTK